MSDERDRIRFYNRVNTNLTGQWHSGWLYLPMTCLRYNWHWVDPDPWYSVYVVSDLALSPGAHSLGHVSPFPFDRLRKLTVGGCVKDRPVVLTTFTKQPVGYHLTYFMPVDEIAEKVRVRGLLGGPPCRTG